MKIFPVIKKAAAAVGGTTTNVLARLKPAIRLTNLWSITLARVAAGVRLTLGPIALRIPLRSALRITSKIEGNPATVQQKPALNIDPRISNGIPARVLTKPAGNIVQSKLALSRTSGANATVSNGPDAWTNPANALGLQNDTDATRNGQLAVATDAQLIMSFDNFTNKTALTITSVILTFYVGQSGTVGNNGALFWYYRTDAGAWIELGGMANTQDLTTTGSDHDITAAIAGDWAKLDALEVRVWMKPGIATAVVQAQCDAVKIAVAAEVTDIL